MVRAREARPSDQPAVEALLNRTRYTSPAPWRWEPHLADGGFIVVETGTRSHHSPTNRICGALCASPDASPVAWTRLAAVDTNLGIARWLDLSLPPILSHLRNCGVRELAWLDYGEWGRPHLEASGFGPLTEVITLTKTDRHLPAAPERGLARSHASAINLRLATDADLAAIVTIDRASFQPHWWRSETTVRRRAATASWFTVAEYEGELIGYTEREVHLPMAHLNRIAIHPHYQGRGIGTVLLRDALRTMWQSGVGIVSLNTQSHNRRSQRLYEHFGFQTTGDAVTVWTRYLMPP